MQLNHLTNLSIHTNNTQIIMSDCLSKQKNGSHYAPRNVMNAAQIKGAILARSEQRNDPENIRAWLKNHFYRFVIGNFLAEPPEFEVIDSIESAQNFWSLSMVEPILLTIPDWLTASLENGNTLYWIAPEGSQLLKIEAQFVEFLHARKGTVLENKLMRVNTFQALALYEYEHQLFALRRQSGLQQHHEDATRCCLKTAQGEFVELLPDSAHFRNELVYESQRMQHCIGQFADRKNLTGGYAEHYAAACEKGELKIFSFRTENHHPRITISARVNEEGKLLIEEVKGKQNKPPIEKYHQSLLAFLNTLPCELSLPHDLFRIEIVFADGIWQPIHCVNTPSEQNRIAWQLPSLAKRLPRVPAIGQWMLAARAPEMLLELEGGEYIQSLIGIND